MEKQKPKTIPYTCSSCGRVEQSGELPEPPALAIYPLPKGWVIYPTEDHDLDDAFQCAECEDADQLQLRIYVASKTKHAWRWLELRALGRPIVSTWIDEAGEGETTDLADLWDRCIREASTATAVVVYAERDEVLKGAYVEVGAALALGVPVFLVGDPSGTCWHHRLVTRCASVDEAFLRALGAWLNA